MRYAIQFCLQAHTLRHGVMHASLHESAMSTTVLHVFHVMRRIRGPFLCQDCSRREQTDQQKLHRTHWYPRRLARSERHVFIISPSCIFQLWSGNGASAGGVQLFVLLPQSPKLNAHVERSHRTHSEEFYQVQAESDHVPRLKLRRWEETYNCVRPHQSLACLTPWEFISRWKRNLGKGNCH